MPKEIGLNIQTGLAIALDYQFGLSRRKLMLKYPGVSERQIRKIMACLRDDPLLAEMGAHIRWQLSFTRFLGTERTDFTGRIRNIRGLPSVAHKSEQ